MTLKEIRTYYSEYPFKVIFFIALLVRIIAAIFSKGYGWHDDQFLIIEVAQSWVDGIDYYGWLPTQDGLGQPEGFSFFYVGLHYIIFSILESIGITNSESKMLIIRLLHALWSTITVYYGIKITDKISNSRNAKIVGWLLALFWIFPMISVRNLTEYVSIPPLMYGLWVIVSSDSKTNYYRWFWAGIVMGIAFNIRFQSGLIIGSMGLVLLFQKKWLITIVLGIGVILSIILVQGGIDYLVWKKPLVQLLQYVTYNSDGTNISGYPQGDWYVYILFISGIMIPPISIFILTGMFKEWKRILIIFLPVILFLIFHSYYPNKQERFVVTIMPFIMIIGIIGWQRIVCNIRSDRVKSIIRGSWIFFWLINFLLLIPITIMYSKKARVETMIYMAQFDDINNFMIEDVNRNVLGFPPQFYLKSWYNYHTLLGDSNFEEFAMERKNDSPEFTPGFILFYQPDNLEQRVENIKTIYPNLTFEVKIEPGYMDKVLYWLNPINANQNIYIYRNTDILPL